MARKKRASSKKGRPAVVSLGRSKKSPPKVRLGRGPKGGARKPSAKSKPRGRSYR